jgi:hypothetical protein
MSEELEEAEDLKKLLKRLIEKARTDEGRECLLDIYARVDTIVEWSRRCYILDTLILFERMGFDRGLWVKDEQPSLDDRFMLSLFLRDFQIAVNRILMKKCGFRTILE